MLAAASLVVPFCVGFEYSTQRNRAPLTPLFMAAPAEKKALPKATFLLVDVAGKVRHPGLQKLPNGARVFQAIEAAGGALENDALQKLNLAESVRDGQKIVVGETLTVVPTNVTTARSSTRSLQNGAAEAVSAPRKSSLKALPTSPININTASLAELETLPGVGPALASRVVAARAQKRLSNTNDLDAISGIGPKKLEAMRPFVSF